MKYRTKPVIKEAIQIKSGNLKEVETFLAGKEMPEHWVGSDNFQINWGNSTVKIKTLEGVMLANTGDFIIKGLQGEFYPCKPDIFEKTYELVEEQK